MAERQRVLLIEDNPGDVRLIREMLSEGNEELFELDCVGRLSQGLEYLSTRSAGVVLLDLSLPDSYGFDTFLKVYAHSPKVPIIVLTGHDDRTVALSAVETGAQDYLVKGKIDRDLLLRSMQYSIERKRYQEQLEYQRTTMRSPGCRTAICFTTGSSNRCTPSASCDRSGWCFWTSTTSSSSTTASGTTPATSCCRKSPNA
jgi:DNA-binding response OmpR family regulator